MKVQWLGAALVAIAAELGMALPASAQSPVFVTRNGSFFQDDNSPSDAVTPPMESAIVAPEAAEAAEEAAGEEAAEAGPWTIGDMFPGLAQRNMYLNGSMVGSFTYNTASPADRYNGPMTWTDRSNEFQLNQLWLNFGKNVDMDNDDQFFDLGGKITTAWGSNYRWYTAAGLEDEWAGNRDHRHYGLALPNMYLETKTGKVQTKFGRFASPVGYFGIDSSQNLFNQLPYTFQYGEPFTHVGFLSTWKQTDDLTLGAGMVRGWDSWDGSGTANHGVGVVGTASYAIEEGKALNYFGIYSEEPSKLAFNTTTPRYLQSVVYTSQVTEKLLYVFQTDFGTQSLAGLGDPVLGVRPGNAYWYGINQYLAWKQTDVVSWVGNFEWFRDDGGFRVGGVLPTDSYQVGGVPASQVRGLPTNRYGYNGSFYRLMAGPRFTTGDNLFFRTALAFDWYDGAANNPGNLLPFDDGTKNTQLVLSGDFVLLY